MQENQPILGAPKLGSAPYRVKTEFFENIGFFAKPNGHILAYISG